MMVSICFVCLGNICRSPTAEGIFLNKIKKDGLDNKICVESAGTLAFHAGEKADIRTQSIAKKRGIELTTLSQKFTLSDFEKFDYIIAMDRSNYKDLKSMSPNQASIKKIHLARSFESPKPSDMDVPDPYYKRSKGFEEVFDICERVCTGLLKEIREKYHF